MRTTRLTPAASFMRALKSAALVMVLLLAEAFAVVHPLDLDAHANDDACKICLSVASFGGANVGAASTIAVPAASSSLVVVPIAPGVVTRIAKPFARGPPSAS